MVEYRFVPHRQFSGHNTEGLRTASSKFSFHQSTFATFFFTKSRVPLHKKSHTGDQLTRKFFRTAASSQPTFGVGPEEKLIYNNYEPYFFTLMMISLNTFRYEHII